jgi:hypothetical protein
MNQYPKVLAAARRAAKSQWGLADALLQELGPPRQGKRDKAGMKACVEELRAAGHAYTEGYLYDLRMIAAKFQSDDRRLRQTSAEVPLQIAREAGTPAVLQKAAAMAEEEGAPLTARYAARVRKAAKKRSKKVPKAKRAEHIEKAEPSAVRREVDVIGLTTLALDARSKGRQLLKALADVGALTEQEREELAEEVQQVVATWSTVLDAVRNPVGDDAERFLRLVSEGGA